MSPTAITNTRTIAAARIGDITDSNTTLRVSAANAQNQTEHPQHFECRRRGHCHHHRYHTGCHVGGVLPSRATFYIATQHGEATRRMAPPLLPPIFLGEGGRERNMCDRARGRTTPAGLPPKWPRPASRSMCTRLRPGRQGVVKHRRVRPAHPYSGQTDPQCHQASAYGIGAVHGVGTAAAYGIGAAYRIAAAP